MGVCEFRVCEIIGGGLVEGWLVCGNLSIALLTRFQVGETDPGEVYLRKKIWEKKHAYITQCVGDNDNGAIVMGSYTAACQVQHLSVFSCW